MWTKLLPVFAVSFLTLAAGAQTVKPGTAKPGTGRQSQAQQTSSRQQHSSAQSKQRKASKASDYDPTVPTLDAALVNSIVSETRINFVENKWPQTLAKVYEAEKKGGKERRIPGIELISIVSQFKSIYDNPDLEEVTATRKAWFRELGRALVAFDSPLQITDDAANMNSEKRYEYGKSQIPPLSANLQEVLKSWHQYKIPAKELKTIRERNIERRRAEIEKKMREGKL